MTAMGPDEIKRTQQTTWETGDYGRIGNRLQYMSELLCESVGVLPHHRLLDVATGTGNSALAAARRNCEDVTGIDFAPELIDAARERATAENVDVRFEVGDAEDLPFPSDSFDIVLSTIGVMFAPDQERAASELVRVCRPGGRIGLANWTPDGFAGQLLKTVGGYAPPPPGLQPPPLWGTEDRLEELFGDRVDLNIERREFVFKDRSPDHYVDTYRTYFGPVIAAMSRIEEEDRQRLADDMRALISNFSRPAEESIDIPSSYLEVVATVR